MNNRSMLKWGAVPVPYAALWTAEQGHMHVERCPHINMPACCDAEARGQGKPVFGKPHMTRQREVIINDLCDLCAKPLKLKTKVSLSHSRPVASGADGLCIMQVEPMLHKECAAVCVQHCPSLKRDIAAGTIVVRQVIRYRHQIAMLTAAAVEEFTGKPQTPVAGHAKVELQRWINRDLTWLGICAETERSAQ